MKVIQTNENLSSIDLLCYVWHQYTSIFKFYEQEKTEWKLETKLARYFLMICALVIFNVHVINRVKIKHKNEGIISCTQSKWTKDAISQRICVNLIAQNTSEDNITPTNMIKLFIWLAII